MAGVDVPDLRVDAAGPVHGPAEDTGRGWERRVGMAHELAGRLAAVHADLVAFTTELIATDS